MPKRVLNSDQVEFFIYVEPVRRKLENTKVRSKNDPKKKNDPLFHTFWLITPYRKVGLRADFKQKIRKVCPNVDRKIHGTKFLTGGEISKMPQKAI